MLEKILLKAISSSNYSCPGHIVQTYNNICQTCRFCDLIMKFRAQQYLPVVYVSRVDLLPKLKKGRIKVDVRIIINTFGLFSGILIALKSIFNNKKWNNSWIVLLLSSNGWILLGNIFWKSKR